MGSSLPSSTPDGADLIHAAEDGLLGAVVAIANSHHVMRPPSRAPPLSGDPASSRDLITSPYHSKITIILFPESCIGPCNLNLLITISF